MKLTCPGVPEGAYTLEFLGIEEQPENEERGFAAGLCWRFVVVGGNFDGQVVTRITGGEPKPGVNAGYFFEKITGQAPAPGITVDFSQHAGKRFNGIVDKAPSGKGTRVEKLLPLEE
jgi:hypothetical protein